MEQPDGCRRDDRRDPHRPAERVQLGVCEEKDSVSTVAQDLVVGAWNAEMPVEVVGFESLLRACGGGRLVEHNWKFL